MLSFAAEYPGQTDMWSIGIGKNQSVAQSRPAWSERLRHKTKRAELVSQMA
jgi:hypothetical protein